MTARGQARNAFPALRIFVFGQEVTEDVLSCTVNWADDTRAPSTASFTLASPLDRYLITPEDLFSLYPTDLDPVTVSLPDVRNVLANDPTLWSFKIAFETERTREGQLRFIQNFTGSREEAVAILKRGESVLQQFAESETLPEIASREEDIRTQIKQRVLEIQDPVKRRVLLAKYDKTQRIEQPDLHETGETVISDVRRAAYLKGEAHRYDFYARRPIFHSNDPVRIFWRDPFAPTIWYFMFSGFVSDWGRSTTANNVNTVTFTCEDVLRPFRYARLTTNPGIFDIRELQQDEDFVVRTFFNDDFSGITLTELLYTLVFGPELPGTLSNLKQSGNVTPEFVERVRGSEDVAYVRYAANGGVSEQRVPRFGVGAFNFERSATFILGPTTDAPQSADTDWPTPRELLNREVRLDGSDALSVYQAVVDHQVRVSDLETMALPEQAVSRSALPRDPQTGEPTIESVISAIGENPHRYPVDGGRLIVLAPASLGPNVNRSILTKDFKGVDEQTTFKNRLGILLNVLQRIEFSFYATPKGDVLAEMPLYDFDPQDFGEAPVTPARANDAIKSTRTTAADREIVKTASTGTVGPFAPHYRVALRDTMDTDQTFTDEKIRTQFRTDSFNVQGLDSAGLTRDIGLPPQVITLRSLVPQFGVRVEQADPPTFVSSPEAARVYCALKLNQWNAEALTSTVDMLPQLRLGPNRPIEVADGPYIATVRSVSRVLNWEGHDMSQSVGLNYTRVWDGQVLEDGKTPVYSPIGGAASRPLNYAALFRRRAPQSSSKSRGNALPAAFDAFNRGGTLT